MGNRKEKSPDPAVVMKNVIVSGRHVPLADIDLSRNSNALPPSEDAAQRLAEELRQIRLQRKVRRKGGR